MVQSKYPGASILNNSIPDTGKLNYLFSIFSEYMSSFESSRPKSKPHRQHRPPSVGSKNSSKLAVGFVKLVKSRKLLYQIIEGKLDGIVAAPLHDNYIPEIHEEYASMIINFADFIKCDLFVFALASNYCRVLDELRATIERKPEALFTDISSESCSNPPFYEGRKGSETLNFY